MKSLKKAIVMFMCACMAFSFSACSEAAATLSFDSTKPWANANGTEQLVYDITKEAVKTDSNGNITWSQQLASGEISYTVSNNPQKQNSAVLTTDYYLEYNQNAPEADRGKRDTMTARSEFSTISMITSYSERTVVLESRDYDDYSYSYTADYNSGRGEFIDAGGKRNIKLSGSVYYDNEILFYLVRALKLKTGFTSSFTISSMYDSGRAKSHVLFNMYLSTNSVLTAVDNIPLDFTQYGLSKNSADCYKLNLSINATNGGTPIVLFYSSEDLVVSGETVKKALVKYYSFERSYVTGEENYRTTYTLKSITL